jgi:hypothetical protein
MSRNLIGIVVVLGCLFTLAATWPCAEAYGAIASFQNGGTDPFAGGTYFSNNDIVVADQDQANIHRNQKKSEPANTTNNRVQKVLIRFDVTSIAGAYSTINSVTLRLYQDAHWGGTQTVNMFRIADANAGWVEGDSVSPGGKSTWNHRINSTTAWAGSAGLSTSGTDYDATVLDSEALSSSTVDTDIDFEVTGINLTDLMDD